MLPPNQPALRQSPQPKLQPLLPPQRLLLRPPLPCRLKNLLSRHQRKLPVRPQELLRPLPKPQIWHTKPPRLPKR